jgi:hypothetical protein
LSHAVKIAGANQTITSAMAADKVFPQLSQEIRYVNLFAPEMAKYVDAADSECTMIAPDNAVRAAAISALKHSVSSTKPPLLLASHLQR